MPLVTARPAPPRPPLLAAVAAVLFVALVVVAVPGGGGPLGVDLAVRNWMVDHRTAGLIDAFQVISDSGSRGVPHVMAAVAGALTAPRRWYVGAAVGLGALIGAQLIRFALVNAFDRPRPPVGDWTTHVNNPALPSGHATTSALAAIGLAAALLPYCHRAATRALAVAVPAAWALAVAVSRLVLGVHWASDLVAGWLLATALSALALPPLARLLRAVNAAPTPRGGP
ncbi:phosphatase PAP2 family protein [Streptomyces radicis]|uniref:Phosphatase PAP2 family protein n=1 Tax=Streptomyces radicis TaxID=1750517 RepID=A0A3A9WEL0_9ACTN|nr:phosphatase PAP2 family protein [Streptomyces radicis]RKN11478.1 phosphatase PAP2 family protein [Streptomyces radicis]RKN26503.1 phosphatase PAP2 family protein [Streptomyces radicis]